MKTDSIPERLRSLYLELMIPESLINDIDIFMCNTDLTHKQKNKLIDLIENCIANVHQNIKIKK